MIQLKNIAVKRGNFTLQGLNLQVPKGEYLTLLGPSGAGKSVLLEAIMGLHRPNQGTLRLNGEQTAGIPPERRNISYLPQDLALFPHLSVRDNILFGARARKLDMDAVRQQYDELVDLLNIEPLLTRKRVQTLSGGEQQRVSLARALLTQPQILLLDEPFSALDACIKRHLQLKLRQISRELGVTVVHVTHDREEAFMLGETIAVMIDGQLQQIGTHDDLYYRPASVAVARFLLNQNIFKLKVAEVLDNDDLRLQGSLPLQTKNPGNLQPGATVYAGIRGEEVIILRAGRPVPDWLQINRFDAVVTDVCQKGGQHAVFVHLDEYALELELEIPNCAFRDLNIKSGERLDICLKKPAIWVIPSPDDC